MDLNTYPKFPVCDCGCIERFNMPDSLAFACKKCGNVIVDYGDHWEIGASIQQWLEDVYGKK